MMRERGREGKNDEGRNIEEAMCGRDEEDAEDRMLRVIRRM